MTREEWLKSLKAGDKVANKNGGSYNFYEVKKITPAGQMRLTNNTLLNQDGKYYSYSRFGSTSYDIEEITEEIVEYLKNRKKKTALYLEVRDLLEVKTIEISSLNIEQLENLKNKLTNI